MQKMIQFYHNKGIDMLKLGCTLPNLANICLHKSTNYKFYPFCESDKDLCEKIREDMTGGPSIVFTRKAVVDETFIRDSSNICKSIVGIDASQLYPYSMCQDMPTGLYTRWEFDTDMQKFKARHNRTRNFENMVMSFYQESRPECKIESFFTSGKQKKIDCFNVDGYCKNKDVVPTLEAMQKMIQFYHNKGIDMLKLGCTLPNLANICPHKSTNYKFYPFCESDKDLCEKIREDMTGGPSIVFTRKAVVDETFIRDSSSICKSIVGIDASQLYPYSMCQDMPTGLYTRWEFDTDMQKFKARHNRTRNFENMVMSFYQESRPECKIESFFTSGKQKKIDCFNVDGYCEHCKTVFEAMGCYYHFCSCQETRPSLTEQDIERGNKKREMDDMRREYIKEKGYKVEEMWECEWWQNFKTDEKIKNQVRTHFPYKRPLSTDSLLAKIKDGSLFGYVQCDLVVPDELKSKFLNFPPILKNTEVGRNDIGDYMKNYAIENEMLKHPQRMLISSFKLENGTVITPFFNFYLELGLRCTKIYRFVEYSPRKCFNIFVQSVVDARREGDENALSGNNEALGQFLLLISDHG